MTMDPSPSIHALKLSVTKVDAGGPELLDVTSSDDIRRAIDQFVPGARVLATDAHDWNTDEFSQGTWMAYRPGQLMRFHSAFQQPEGRVAFAGSDLALGWAGAVRP